ncbi:MAG: MopE-related protein, partial [Bacteroidota bacterium]
TIWYEDSDLDNYGNPAVTLTQCVQPVGYVLDNSDCNDTEATINPGATEVCDEIDNNCDGSVDEGLNTTWYIDNDSDGYGDINTSQISCTQPEGYVGNNTDCDDNDSDRYPAAPALPDGKDNDCDGTIDKVSQEITFEAIPDMVEGGQEYTITVSASSGLNVDLIIDYGYVTLTGNIITPTSAGQVSITAYQNGDSNYETASSVTQTFCVNPPKPVITTLSEDPYLLNTETTENVEWYLNGSILPGAISETYEATESGNYQVAIIVDNCISELSDIVEVVITGIDDLSTNSLEFFPNPSNGEIRFRFSESNNDTWELTIIDSKGVHVIQSQKVNFTNGELDYLIQNRIDGLYTYILINSKNDQVFRGQFVLK